LEKFEGLNISGAPFLPRGEVRYLSANALTANILCERHNNALAPLDQAAIHAVDTIKHAFDHARKLAADNRSRHYLISGDGLERWALKTLLGLYHAKIVAFSAQPVQATHSLDVAACVAALFDDKLLPPPLGLYVHFSNESTVQDHIQFAPLAPDNGAALLSGLHFNMMGLMFDLVVDVTGAEETFAKRQGFFRPTIIDIDTELRVSRIVATWPDRTPNLRRIAVRTAWEPVDIVPTWPDGTR
jgi:hypothetical protein